MGSRKSLGTAGASASTKTPRGAKRASQADTLAAVSSARRRKRARLSDSPDPLSGPAGEADDNEGGDQAVIAISDAPNGHMDDTDGGAEGMDSEKEMEAWLDFAQDHYEMVEQLPLELHRNFRLLKELDDGCIAQTEKLQKLIRRYISERQALAKALDEARRGVSAKPAPEQKPSGAEKEIGAGFEEEEVLEVIPEAEPEKAAPAPVKSGNPARGGEAETGQEASDCGPAQQIEHETLGVPVPDGLGGLLVPALDESSQGPDHPRPFPTVLAENDTTATKTSQAGAARDGAVVSATDPAKASEVPKEISLPRPYLFLPEIGRLAREIVRNGEEKVAVAIGAYNSIDRHIRALDSAMPAQEASILLGLRPDTMPTAYLEPGLKGDEGEAQDGQQHDEDGDDEINIGIGGAATGSRLRSRKGRKKGRKGGKATQTAELVVQEKSELETAPDPLLAADPNEPRYCICNQVSYGQMIGCDNDDCPIEWFHLGCVDLLKPPEGKWLCPVCRPQTSGVAAVNAGKHAGGSAGPTTSKGKTKKAVPKGAHKRRR